MATGRTQRRVTAPPGRERTPGPVEEAIADLALRGYTPAQIHQVLPGKIKAIAKAEKWRSYKTPSLRTVQRIARAALPDDGSGVWQIEDSPADDARVVLDVLAGIITETEGRVTTVTRNEARWIAQLQRIGPPLKPLRTLSLSRHYAGQRVAGHSTRGIDLYLAFAPWRSQEATDAFITAFASRWVGGVTLGDLEDIEDQFGGLPPGLLEAIWPGVTEAVARIVQQAQELRAERGEATDAAG